VNCINIIQRRWRRSALVVAGPGRGNGLKMPDSNFRTLRRVLVLALMVACGVMVAGAEETFPVLNAGDNSYTNVVVTGKTAMDVFISCSQGIATIKVRDLDEGTRLRLGYPAHLPPAPNPVVMVDPSKSWRKTAFETLERHKWLAFCVVMVLAGLPLWVISRRPERTDFEKPKYGQEPLNLDPAVLQSSRASELDDLPTHDAGFLLRHGNRMQSRYNGHQNVCEICQSTAVSQLQTYYWRCILGSRFKFTPLNFLLLFVGYYSVTVVHDNIEFETTHSLCKPCVVQTRLKRILSVLTKAAAFFLLLTCLAITVIGGVIILHDAFSGVRLERGYLEVFGAGVAGLILSWLGHKWERRLRIPSSFRTIGRRPFWLRKVRTMMRYEQRVPAIQGRPAL